MRIILSALLAVFLATAPAGSAELPKDPDGVMSMIREAIDDFRRIQRDREVNGSRYVKLTHAGKVSVASSDGTSDDVCPSGDMAPATAVR